ncbi:MAG TPA: glutamate ABC transporter substrate-binding protein [Acidimicrobiales bacterium]|nr:glutamate ABC transporter substrate-binding protein [Acidimicrobiales bacterium]
MLAVFGLVAVGCSSSNDSGTVKSGSGTTVTTSGKPTFAAGTTMANLQAKGKITVGVKYDQPGFGQRNPTTSQIEGFDVEIAKLMAVGIFGGTVADAANKITFTEAQSANREPFIQNGTVDMVIATYTINDTRKQIVDFAGPYFVTHQDIMVKATDTSIKSVNDLNGKKVCSVTGSTSATNVKAKAPTVDLTLFGTYSDCAAAMSDGRVVAVTTDAPILAGLVQASSGQFKLVKAPFSDEPYGIGMKKGDDAFRSFLNDRLDAIYKSGEWASAFSRTLGAIGLDTPTPPPVDRYTSGAVTSTTGASSTTSTTR